MNRRLTPDCSELVKQVALALCEARGENPDGAQVRFVDGDAHSATFLQIAAHDVRTVLAAIERHTPTPEPCRQQLRDEIINTPETADFMAAVPIEAAHQRERWGSEHDDGKTPFDWFWLVGYLAQKAAASAVAGDAEKALHHTISTAAALANWHAALSGKDASMRAGIGPSNGGDRPGSAYDLASKIEQEQPQ